MFKVEFEVRDNEIDIQGIVNNANYFNYLSHTRSKWLDHMGINISEWAKNNQLLVVVSSNAQYKIPLKPTDTFYVTCSAQAINSKVKLNVAQEIRLRNSDKLVLTAEFTITCINGNASSKKERLYIPELLRKAVSLAATTGYEQQV